MVLANARRRTLQIARCAGFRNIAYGGGRKGEAVSARRRLPFYVSSIPRITSDKACSVALSTAAIKLRHAAFRREHT
jgi:hypothetical protein